MLRSYITVSLLSGFFAFTVSAGDPQQKCTEGEEKPSDSQQKSDVLSRPHMVISKDRTMAASPHKGPLGDIYDKLLAEGGIAVPITNNTFISQFAPENEEQKEAVEAFHARKARKHKKQ